jgi:hypothetical protein
VIINGKYIFVLPIPMAELSKARVSGHSLSGTAGWNPAAGMDVCCECCVLSLRQADLSSRGVVLTVVCHCV